MWIARRILMAVPLLWLIATIAFFLVRVAPGGPFDSERAAASPAAEAALRAKYRLDQPLWSQYTGFLSNLTHGDFGLSLKYRNHSVTDIIQQALPVSLALRASWTTLPKVPWPVMRAQPRTMNETVDAVVGLVTVNCLSCDHASSGMTELMLCGDSRAAVDKIGRAHV